MFPLLLSLSAEARSPVRCAVWVFSACSGGGAAVVVLVAAAAAALFAPDARALARVFARAASRALRRASPSPARLSPRVAATLAARRHDAPIPKILACAPWGAGASPSPSSRLVPRALRRSSSRRALARVCARGLVFAEPRARVRPSLRRAPERAQIPEIPSCARALDARAPRVVRIAHIARARSMSASSRRRVLASAPLSF